MHHSKMKFRKKNDWEEKTKRVKYSGTTVIPWLERYIKAISGAGVCRALVTVPTPLIMFCKVARRKKMKKLWGEGRNGKMKGTGTATFQWRSCG